MKNTNHSASELMESRNFCDKESIVDIKKKKTKKNAYDLKESHSETSEQLCKEIFYLECYSTREYLKFIRIREVILFSSGFHGENEKITSEHTKAVIYKILEEELDSGDPHQRLEFKPFHRLGKQNRNDARPTRILCFANCEEVSQKSSMKLNGTHFPVYRHS